MVVGQDFISGPETVVISLISGPYGLFRLIKTIRLQVMSYVETKLIKLFYP